MDIEKLKHDLKVMIIEECEKEDITPEEIDNDVELFSEASGLELDSLDGLTISMALQKQYGLRIGDPKAFRRILTTTSALAEYIVKEQNG